MVHVLWLWLYSLMTQMLRCSPLINRDIWQQDISYNNRHEHHHCHRNVSH